MPCCMSSMSRRALLKTGAALPALDVPSGGHPLEPGARRTLRVQPVLIYQIFKPRPQTSWRPWGGLFTEKEVAEERARIGRELETVSRQAAYPVEFLPLREVRSVEEGKAVAEGAYDVLLMYPASGGVRLLESAARPERPTVIFVRHRSGPVYEWYEIVHPRFLRKTDDDWGQPGAGPADVVVDETADLAWRLRALGGLKHTQGRRVLCLGGASGWGAGGRRAPQLARERFGLDLAEVSYDELGRRIQAARKDDKRVRQAALEAGQYAGRKGVKLETKREFVDNAFLLADVLREMLREAGATALTINHCMSTIMPIGETTACLPLSLLNDQGYLAFCESDFVVIPSGILLQAVSGLPVFLNDPTTPHHGLVTLAHCTAPRRMDGKSEEPARLVTHFESDYGAAPKVEMRIGQKVTNIIPDFSFKRWVGFEGEIVATPFLPICRSQIDVGFRADAYALASAMRGFHWMTCYGDWRKEVGYALSKVGIEWVDMTA